MTDGWYPAAIDNWASVDGGSFFGPVTIGLLHTTESSRFVPAKDSYFGHKNYPHLTVANQDGKFVCWQHISIRKAARALANRSGGVQTNREGVIQIEVVGRAVSPFTRDPIIVEGLKKLMRWIESQTNIPRKTRVTFWEGKYGINVPHRMSNAQWTSYEGWCAHQHAPENSHYDAGKIDIELLLRADSTKPPVTPHPVPVTPESDMSKTYIVTDPREIPNLGRPQYLTDLLQKRWINSMEEYNDILGSNAGPNIERIELNQATLDAIPTIGRNPFEV